MNKIVNEYRVIEEWKSNYPNPIILKSGENVIIDNTKINDEIDWKGWVWCITKNNAGWVPEQILTSKKTTNSLSNAFVSEDYSANELNVSIGDIVMGCKFLNGWLWCQKENSNIFGWLPIRNLIKICRQNSKP